MPSSPVKADSHSFISIVRRWISSVHGRRTSIPMSSSSVVAKYVNLPEKPESSCSTIPHMKTKKFCWSRGLFGIVLLAKEGWPRHQKNGPVPNRRGRGGRSRVTFRNAFFKHLRVSDHPVCGASVASRLFIDAAATLLTRGSTYLTHQSRKDISKSDESSIPNRRC